MSGGRGGGYGWRVGVSVGGLAVGVAAGGRLVQFPSFPGRQLSQDFFAFTQAQPLQEPNLLHLQHAIFQSCDAITPWKVKHLYTAWTKGGVDKGMYAVSESRCPSY